MDNVSGVTPITQNPRKDRIVELYLMLANVSATIRNQMMNNTAGSRQTNVQSFNGLMYELCTLSSGYILQPSMKKRITKWRNTPKPDVLKTLELFEDLVDELSDNDVIKR